MTAGLSDETGGAIYDSNFYELLKKEHPDVRLFDDNYFKNKYQGGSGLLSFNKYYKDSLSELFDCDYLVINTRLYTRFVFSNIKNQKQLHPNTRIIAIHHHSNFMNHNGVLRLIHRHFESIILKESTELVIPNQYVIDHIKRDFNFDNIVHLPSSFEKTDYPISKLNNKRLLFVGSVEKRKGVIYGIKAFKSIVGKFPDYKYHIVGKYSKSDRYFKKLVKYVNKNGLDNLVIFEGRVDSERLSWLYEKSDLFVFPSLLEGYGWVMIEAMGRGLPVVSFDNSAMPYTVKDNINGVLVKNKDSNEMAKRICELLPDRNRMVMLQKGALDTYSGVPSKVELNQMTLDYIKSWS
ncbi:MAG: glycosyltransferase family 4 protein [Saccharofermentans sp.]|nr:glycosyltransferase family 4 protein [Saccharofermentans sp.]